MTGPVLRSLAAAAVLAVSAAAAADEWENPVFATEAEAVDAARQQLGRIGRESPPALRLFVDLTIGEVSDGARPGGSGIAREVVEGLLVTYPGSFAEDRTRRAVIDRFRGEIGRQLPVLERRLARFGYPSVEGLVYLRLVASVDAFADLDRASSDRMSRVGGVTYYCRYVVLPLSYVGEHGIRELRREAARNPSLDVEGTIRRWELESFANLVSTFRHEMVHVRTNTALGVPAYRSRSAYPTWFHEGSATYLAADPHAGLSARYQEYQEAFFYLARRFGIRKLQSFFVAVVGGQDVGSSLRQVYGITDSKQLFERSGRWHRTADAVTTAFWIAALVIVAAAFRGVRWPLVGTLQLLVALGLALAVAGGLADHLYGLRGPTPVLAAELAAAAVAVLFGFAGLRRVTRFLRAPA